VDSDYDGLPDVVEDLHGFDKNNNKSLSPDKDDGNADFDTSNNNAYQGDGLTNFREYRGILLDKLTKDNAGKVTGIVVKGEHQRLNPGVKDLFVRGDGYLNSTECGPSSTNKPLYCSDTDILTFTIGLLGGETSFTNAFEHAGIAVHDVTGMPSFYAYDGTNEATRYVEPPNIDILVMKNETSTTDTIIGSANGFINLVAVRYWTWDTKGAAYFGDANSYHIWVNQTTGTISRGAYTYHLNLMHYFYNRPYFDVVSSDGLYVANSVYNGLLDPQSLVEDRILENGALEITRKTSTNEDNNPADGKMRGDHMKTDWWLKSAGRTYRTGYNFSTFDADADGLVELPVVADAKQIIKEYTPLKVQRQTIMHEMGHAAGIRNPEHPCEVPNVMCVPVVDWEKAGSFSVAGQQQLLIHNKTE
jgi:hypothetical protein